MKRVVAKVIVLSLAWMMFSCAGNGEVKPIDSDAEKPSVFTAIRDGNIQELKSYIESGNDINKTDQDGLALLLVATRYDQLDMVQFLLSKGAKPHTKSPDDYESPFIAAIYGSEAVLRYWIDEGFPIETKQGKYSETLLHKAAEANQVKIVGILLKYKVNVEAKTKDGWTALHYAAQGGFVEICKLLIKNGVSIDSRTTFGETPLHWAANKGQIEVMRLLVQSGADVNDVNQKDWTPLHSAASEGHLEAVRFLIESEADIDFLNGSGHTALQVAADKGYSEIIRYLIEKGSDPNSADPMGYTALHIASSKGFLETVKVLVENGADIEAADLKYGFTALHYAAGKGYLDVVQYLVSKGSDLNHSGDMGLDALGLAEKQDQKAVVKYLRSLKK